MPAPSPVQTTPPSSSRAADRPRLGIAFILLASLLFAIADAFGKLLTEHYPTTQIIWLRSVFGTLLIALAILLSGNHRHFISHRPGWHLVRSGVGLLLTTGIVIGLKFIPLAEVTSLVFATPLLVALYAAFIQGESVPASIFWAIGLGFIGVLCVVRPTPEHFHPAHLFMLCFACAAAFLAITARTLADTESVLTLNLYLYPVTAVTVAYWALTDWRWPDAAGWGVFLLTSLFATLALFCVTKAMHCARPALVAPFDYVRILWTVAIGYLFWDEFPDHFTWLGMLIVVLSGLYIVTRPRPA